MESFEDKTLETSGAMPPSEFAQEIERIVEVADHELVFDKSEFERVLSEETDLAISPQAIKAIAAAVHTGNVVLQGPPGTGKTSLARVVAKAFNVSTTMVTAHDDWTTYDVIGRLELKASEDNKEEIEPVNGCLTESVIKCANAIVNNFDDPSAEQAEWLIIDELNRAHPDKAFGELFTVLGTDSLVAVNLPHQKDGNRKLVIPKRFRIIATLNSYDKQYVNNLSQAIRRRFTFISIDIPPQKVSSEEWSLDEKSTVPANIELRCICKKACKRASARLMNSDDDDRDVVYAELFSLISDDVFVHIAKLMDLVASVRYSNGVDHPYLPIGTAQLIDAVDLFLTRFVQSGKIISNAAEYLDWAVSVKIAPLFEADIIDHELLSKLTSKLPAPFDNHTKRELAVISGAGMHYIPTSW